VSRTCLGCLGGLAVALGVVLAAGAETGPGPAAASPAAEAVAGPSPAPTAGADASRAPSRIAPQLDSLERAWFAPARRLVERVARTRHEADQLGLVDLEPLARAVLLGAGDATPLERADAAVELAPDLPAAHWARARARFGSADLLGGVEAACQAIRALSRHLESSLWLTATASLLLYAAVLSAGLAYLAGRGLAALPHAAHDLADRIDPSMSEPARRALITAAVLAPAALGQGVLGAALGLFALATIYATRAERRALAAAAALVVLAIHPLVELAGRQLAALGSDAVAEAAWASESGFLDPVDLMRLEHAEPSDTLATQALAARARRAGDLAQADARYAALIAASPSDPVALNNAANVRLALGDSAGAIELYRRATAEKPSALIWFNLSQAHGRAIQVDEHERALAAAQAIDTDVVDELTRRLSDTNAGFTAELPLPVEIVRERLARGGEPIAAELRAPLAPGALGRFAVLSVAAFVAAAALGIGLAGRFERSTACAECSARLCARCGTPRGSHDLCAACTRRRRESHHGGPWDSARASAGDLSARARRWPARALPGLVGPAPRRPALALAANVAGAAALAAVLGRHGAVPDPASVGGAGPLAFGCAALLLLALQVSLTAAAGVGGRR